VLQQTRRNLVLHDHVCLVTPEVTFFLLSDENTKTYLAKLAGITCQQSHAHFGQQLVKLKSATYIGPILPHE